MSARMAPALAKSRAARAGSIAIYPRSSRRRRSSALIAQISLRASRSLCVEVVDQMNNLLADGVRHIISARSSARLTDHKIPLRSVPRSVGAVAIWPATALVGLG